MGIDADKRRSVRPSTLTGSRHVGQVNLGSPRRLQGGVTHPNQSWLAELGRFLHDQVKRTGTGWLDLVQNLVQLGAEEAPITPIRSCLLR